MARTRRGLDAGSPSARGAGGYAVCVGRMRPGGGIDRAIAVARMAGTRITIVAGAWEHSERHYFISTIEPLLGADAVFLGEAAREHRLELLARAHALLDPAPHKGHSTPVMAEALMCGTPILAPVSAGVAELVEHGRTGYLCSDDEEMARALAGVVGHGRPFARQDASATGRSPVRSRPM